MFYRNCSEINRTFKIENIINTNTFRNNCELTHYFQNFQCHAKFALSTAVVQHDIKIDKLHYLGTEFAEFFSKNI